MLTHQYIIESEATGHEAASPQEERAHDVAKAIEADLDKASALFSTIGVYAEFDERIQKWRVRLEHDSGEVVARDSAEYMRRWWRYELRGWVMGQSLTLDESHE